MTVSCVACGRPFNVLPDAHCPHCGSSYDPGDKENPPPEELEMAVEGITAKPFAGKPEERVQALEARVAYLIGQVRHYTECALDSVHTCAPDTRCTLDSLKGDLAEARKQLAEWRAQHEGRN